ncbi:MAG: hypothetical protein KJS97_15285 [Alphaproteobacteria bacterium]|nr:hypothetical protein [Alphaproteobacteria bacterium]
MDHATIKLTIGPDGRVTACLANTESATPYDLVVIADDLADAINGAVWTGSVNDLGNSLANCASNNRASSFGRRCMAP